MAGNMRQIESSTCFGGRQIRYRHDSETLNCTMSFGVYLPPAAEKNKVPFLIWLSGLTGRDNTFPFLAGAQRYAAERGIAIVTPDTSPRGEGVPDDPDGAYDFGLSAGFYLNATELPWQKNYHMYDYVVDEFSTLIVNELPIDSARQSIFGHSMGGHGAITIALKNPGRFRSVSAMAPICNPMDCPWGVKAFNNYLGPDRATWRQYDATKLVATSEERLPLLIDQGDEDEFLEEQLGLDELQSALSEYDYPATVRMRGCYDHGYYFVASFIGEHIDFHANYL